MPTAAELQKKVEHWEHRLVEVEDAYTQRKAELNEDLADGDAALTRIRTRIKEYEEALQAIRDADEARAKDLESRENALKARNRAFNLERQDFEAEKKRFYQTRDLQA